MQMTSLNLNFIIDLKSALPLNLYSSDVSASNVSWNRLNKKHFFTSHRATTKTSSSSSSRDETSAKTFGKSVSRTTVSSAAKQCKVSLDERRASYPVAVHFGKWQSSNYWFLWPLTFAFFVSSIHRYSGKTQKQIIEFVRDNYVKRQTFQRLATFSPSLITETCFD